MNEAGAAEQDRMTAVAKQHGIRLLGPNCLGVFNDSIKFYGTFDIGAHGLIELVRNDGTVLLIAPYREGALGRSVASGEIFGRLLPKQVETQVYRAMLESVASEQGSRMTAMDSASKNAGELIDTLTLNMNRIRQAAITKEIIEVVSGAAAL